MTGKATYVAPEPGCFFLAGAEAVHVFDLVDESEECGEGKGEQAKVMPPWDPAAYARQIRFINKTTEKLLIVAFFQENTQAIYDLEEAATAGVAGIAAVGLRGAIHHLKGEGKFPGDYVLFTLDRKSDPSSETHKSTQDLLNGAEGMWYLWFAVHDDTEHFAGRGYVQRRRNCKFMTLGCAEGKFELPEPGQPGGRCS